MRAGKTVTESLMRIQMVFQCAVFYNIFLGKDSPGFIAHQRASKTGQNFNHGDRHGTGTVSPNITKTYAFVSAVPVTPFGVLKI